MANSVFIGFRLSLSARDREILDALARRLIAVTAVPVPPDVALHWARQLHHAAPGLTAEDCQALAIYALAAAATGVLEAGVPAGGVMQAQPAQVQPMQQMSFNLQYLQLQSQMQHENREYTALSNIMKTKHDTVKNSISNVR